MIGRRQLAVASPISSAAIARALFESVIAGEKTATRARAQVAERLDARSVVLTDSGTSALVLALRLAAPRGGVIGFPAFACVDLAAAAQFAGIRVRLYDIDPRRLSPDLDSFDRMLERGVDAVVVAHLYGFPVDMAALHQRTSSAGVPLIEDAAQGAGATIDGNRLGTLGDLGVLSFGRGKGLCAGGGGALIANATQWRERLRSPDPLPSSIGLGNLAKTAVQWLLGRPSLYALPSMLPWLRLGEMVYHPAHEPRGMSRVCSSLVRSAFELERDDLIARRRRGAQLRHAADASGELRCIATLPGAEASFLRFPIVDASRSRTAHQSMGILRSYPATTAEQKEMQALLIAGEPPMPGAIELRSGLFTLPTHRFVTDRDMAALAAWLRDGNAGSRRSGKPANPEVASV
jgi:hypothetical protein